jgi:hypothetical protein
MARNLHINPAGTVCPISPVPTALDFREVNTHAVSRETLLAAILFIRLASAMGMRCEPFFVDAGILDAMVRIAEGNEGMGERLHGGEETQSLLSHAV